MTIKFFYDTEFLEDGRTIELISIGIVASDGREYYAVSSSMPTSRIAKHSWLMENVWPHLPLRGRKTGGLTVGQNDPGVLDTDSSRVKPEWVIANEVRDFITAESENWWDNELWAWYGAYDHVALCQLWGSMIRLPKGVPMFTRELAQLWMQAGRPEKPPKIEPTHNALTDAHWNRMMYRLCIDEMSGDS